MLRNLLTVITTNLHVLLAVSWTSHNIVPLYAILSYELGNRSIRVKEESEMTPQYPLDPGSFLEGYPCRTDFMVQPS